MDIIQLQKPLTFRFFFFYSLIFTILVLRYIPALANQPGSLNLFPALALSIPKKFEPLLLEVVLNFKKLSSIVEIYQDEKKNIWVAELDLLSWNMSLPNGVAFVYQGKNYYNLAAYPQLNYKIDPNALTLSIVASPRLFPTQILGEEKLLNHFLRPDVPGAFINYSSYLSQSRVFNQTTQQNASGLLNVGYFNDYGVGGCDALAYNHYTNTVTHTNTKESKIIRLMTNWTVDKPEKFASLRLGDAFTGTLNWSGSTRFGGIQYATNFATQPNLITFPLPGNIGEATIPSTLSVFVNNVFNQQKNIENGPYIINNIPVVTGAGNIRIETQDILGRTQLVSFPYYASPLLLKKNLDNYSFDLGFIRNNYAVYSNNYGRALASATYQKGLTDKITLEGHAELLRNQQTLGFSSNFILNNYAIFSLALAESRNNIVQGTLLFLSMARQALNFSYGINSTLATPHYQQLGSSQNNLPASSTAQAYMNFNPKEYGSFTLSYTTVNARTFSPSGGFTQVPSSQIITAGYARTIFKNISLMFSGLVNLHNSKNNQISLNLSANLDAMHSLSNYIVHQGNYTDSFQFSKALPVENGYGYNIFASNNYNNYVGGTYRLQTNTGTYTAKSSYGKGRLNYELDADGSIIYFANDVFFAHRMTNSFAVVKVPNFSNVKILYQNQPVGSTNKKGNLLLTHLLPYQENSIEVDPKSLPLDVKLAFNKIKVVPYLHSGSLAFFPARRVCEAIMHLKDKKGRFIPSGSQVNFDTEKKSEDYEVAYEGTVYFELEKNKDIKGRVKWNNENCHFHINPIQTTEILTELGEVVCY